MITLTVPMTVTVRVDSKSAVLAAALRHIAMAETRTAATREVVTGRALADFREAGRALACPGAALDGYPGLAVLAAVADAPEEMGVVRWPPRARTMTGAGGGCDCCPAVVER